MVIIRQEVPTGIQAAREVEASREGTKRWVRTASVSVIDVRRPALLTNAALLTYVIPASFLAIPFYLIMQHYALPPIATYYAFRNRMSSGLTMGGVKG